MRKIRRGTVAVLLALLLAVLGAFAWVQTPPGKRQLARLVERAVSDDTVSISLGEIEGFLPFEFRLSTLALADGEGVWLSADGLTLDWSPLALLSGRLDVDAVRLDRVALDRLPEGPDRAEAGGSLSMPLALRIARFEVADVDLAEPVLGAAARLSVEGRADLADPVSGFRLSADVRRIDGSQGSLSVGFGYDPDSGDLTAEIEGAEPAGGVIARLLQLPGLPPVSLGLSGNGPLEDWRADLTLDAGPEFEADAELGIRAEEDGHRLSVGAGASLAGLLGGGAKPMLAGRSTLRGAALVDRDGVIAFDAVTLKVAAGEIVLGGSADWPRGTLDATVSVVAGGSDVFAAFLPDIRWGRASADIRLEGSIAAPRVEVVASADNAIAAGMSLSRMEAQLSLDSLPVDSTGSSEGIPFEGRGVLTGLATGDAGVDALLAPAISWSGAGAFGLDGSASIDRLTVEGAGAAIAASAEIGGDGTFSGNGTFAVADLGVLRDVAGIALEGRADFSWSARSVDDRIGLETEGRLDGARSGIEAVDAVLDDSVAFRTVATIGTDGAFDVSEFRIDSGGNAIAGTAAYSGDRLSSRWSLTLPSLAGFSDLAGVPLDGRMTAEGEVHGTMERLSLQSDIAGFALSVDGDAIPDLTATLGLDDLTGRVTGDVRLEAAISERTAVLAFGLDLPESGSVRFDPVEGGFAGSTVAGAVELLADGGIDGRLSATADEVAPLAALFDLPLSGQVDLVAGLSAADGRQRLQATLRMADAAYDGRITAATLLAELTVDDLLGTPQLVDGKTTAVGLQSGGATLDRVDVEASGGVDALSVTVAVAGDPYAGDAAGVVTFPDDGTRIGLESLRAVIRGEVFELAEPATIALTSEAVSVDRFAITGGGGQATLAGSVGGSLDVSVDLARVPLTLVTLVEPRLDISGHMDGEARVSGPIGSPQGSFELKSDDLRSGFAENTGLPPADLRATGQWSEGRLALDVAAGLADGAGMTVRVEMPLALDAEGGGGVIDARSDLIASAAGTLDLSLFDDLLAAGGNRVEGLLTVDLGVSGTVDQPVIAGSAELSDARYENAFYGSRLEGISATMAASGTSLRLTDLSAATPGGGTLVGNGSLALDPDKGYPLTLDVGLRNGAVVDTALASATADADLRLSGALAEKLLLSGEVSILAAEFRVPDRLPVSVPDLAVEEVNLPPEIAAGRAAQGPSEPAAAVDAQLDLVASARQAVFVRGRGLDVELDGNLSIKGSAAAPAIDGELGLRSGTFDIFGRRLTFQRGGLDFDGTSDLDPEIDLLAGADVDAASVEVTVAGRVSEPEITLTSVPEMPQDEIAARLLFGKDVRSLTAFEAVTLAQSLGQLAGLTSGSGGLLDEMRRKIGLDRLEVDVGGTGEASVSGGRYVSDGVYVGVEQGFDEQSSRVNVEIEVTPNISVESDVGADAEGRIGVNVEWDY